MNALALRRYKLRDILRKNPQILDELKEARKQGASWIELSLIVYDRTGIAVDPTTVRKWFEQLEIR